MEELDSALYSCLTIRECELNSGALVFLGFVLVWLFSHFHAFYRIANNEQLTVLLQTDAQVFFIVIIMCCYVLSIVFTQTLLLEQVVT